jgi:polar amino acid transport system permease protein
MSQPPSSPRRQAGQARRGSVQIWALVLLGGLFLATHAAMGEATAHSTVVVLRRGLPVTLRVTVLGFGFALALGLIAGLGRLSRNRLLRGISSVYVEVMRGVPMLVLVLWVGFAFAPWLFQGLLGMFKTLAEREILLAGFVPKVLETCRRPSDCLSLELRGIVGLAVGYGAFMAEIVRAGIQSVPFGQTEAAISLGMTRRQAMRHVVLPQAMRLSLPPMGNEFIALLKDSTLVSVLAVPDMVYEARAQVARTFQALEVWNLVALAYLALTLILSYFVRRLERRTVWPGASGSED